MKRLDLWSGAFWVLFAVFVCVKSLEAGLGSFRSPGSGFFPFWAAILFGILALVLAARGLFLRDRAMEPQESGSMKTKWTKICLVLLSLFLYAFLLEKVGFLIMTSALLTLLFGMVGKSKLWVRIASALVTAGLSYVVFYIFLNVPLPKGWLE